MKNIEQFNNFSLNEKINIKYDRVIPRDLFNEAKLLKCMGLLCLLIHEEKTPVKISADFDGSPFEIGLTEDGSLAVVNLDVLVKGISVLFKTTYNSKANFPLFAEYDDTEHLVFTEDGKFADEFVTFCNELESTEEEE